MDKYDKLKYQRPCGAAFAKYGGDLDVKAFGDRLALIDDWIVAARIKMATKGMRVRDDTIEECARLADLLDVRDIAAAIRAMKEGP